MNDKPVSDMSVTELESSIKAIEYHDYCRSMSDDFWYSNGGHDEAKREIAKLKAELRNRIPQPA